MAKAKPGGPSFNDIEDAFRHKKFEPLYLLYGEEDFLIEEMIDLLISNAVDESTKGFNLDIMFGSDVDGKDIAVRSASFPMMGDRRVVIVREFDKVANKDTLLPYIQHPSPSTVLALVANKPDFRTKFFKTLKDSSVALECKYLYEDKIPAWISKRIEQLGKKASLDTCILLQSHVGKSLREIQNEIDKLFIFVGDKKTIDAGDVDQVVGVSREFNIFELQKAIGQKNIKRSVEILERMLEAGEYPVGMIIQLTKYFQKIWLLQDVSRKSSSEFEIAKMIEVLPFWLKDYKEAALHYRDEQIQVCFSALIEADEQLKSSGGDPKLIMMLMVHRILRGNGIMNAVS